MGAIVGGYDCADSRSCQVFVGRTDQVWLVMVPAVKLSWLGIASRFDPSVAIGLVVKVGKTGGT